MAADVGYLVRVMSGYNNNNNNNSSNNIKEEQQHHHHHHQKSTALVTRDLLGGGGGSFGAVHSKELDLDLQVPNGYEKRLDLKVLYYFLIFSVFFKKILLVNIFE